MLIRAYVQSQGKGSYKHKALISIVSYLLNEQKGAKKKALISMQALIKVGSYKHTTTVLLFLEFRHHTPKCSFGRNCLQPYPIL